MSPWQLFRTTVLVHHDDVIQWKHFPRYWPFVRGIHRSPLICARINSWVNNGEAGDLRRHRGHYDVIVMHFFLFSSHDDLVENCVAIYEIYSLSPGHRWPWYWLYDLQGCTGGGFNNLITLLSINGPYIDVIMSGTASQIISVSIVYSTVCSGAVQRKHQSSASLASKGGIHRWIPRT